MNQNKFLLIDQFESIFSGNSPTPFYTLMVAIGFEVSVDGKSQVPGGKLEIINNHKQPFKITGIVNKLPDYIKWRLKEIKPGYSYSLEVEDISKKPGDFTGHLIVRTDQPQKPELVIIVSGYIEEN